MSAGPGFTDAQGVYHFGEADTESLMSDLLNLLPESLTPIFAALKDRIDDLEAVHAGSVLVKPTAVIVTGGSATYALDPNGTVRFTQAATVRVQGIFNVAKVLHDLFLNTTARSAASSIQVQLVNAAGTVIGNATDYAVQHSYTNGSTNSTQPGNGPYWQIETGSQALASTHLRLTNAAKALQTLVQYEGVNAAATGNAFEFHAGGVLKPATAVDGILITASTGTITGSLTVEARANG